MPPQLADGLSYRGLFRFRPRDLRYVIAPDGNKDTANVLVVGFQLDVTL